jgi:hypothetical protein
MATFLINSATQSANGTVNDDIFVVESGGYNKPTVYGNAGNDEFRLMLGANNSSVNFNGAVMNGQAGNDVFVAEFQTAIDWIGNFFGGGQGNDKLLFTAGGGSSADFIGNTLQGGQGNDTLLVTTTAMGVDGLTMNGNEGSDYLVFSASASGVNASDNKNIFLAGGKGFDNVILDIDTTASQYISVAGGADEDRIRLDFAETARDIQVNGGTMGQAHSDSDGADMIYVSAERVWSATIYGNNGDDSINFYVYYTAQGVLIDGGRGNDSIVVSAHGESLDDFTVRGAAGNDLMIMRGSAGMFATTGGGGLLMGDGGNDTIVFTESGGNDPYNTAHPSNVTIEGGAGADLFIVATSNGSYMRSAFATSHNLSGGIFSYASLGDSTIDAMDTIVVGTSGGSSIFEMHMPVAVNAFDGVASFTAGMLEFDTGAASGAGSADPIRLSQIVGVLDATLETGDAVAFKLETGATGPNPSALAGYVFVKGRGDDDLLVEFARIDPDHFTGGESRLVNNGPTTLSLEMHD